MNNIGPLQKELIVSLCSLRDQPKIVTAVELLPTDLKVNNLRGIGI